MQKGTLYLIPCSIGENTPLEFLPKHTLGIVQSLNHFVAENLKTARHFVKACAHPKVIRELEFELLDKKTQGKEVEALVQPLLNGENVGVVSEAGCPGIADPGSELVKLAHQKGIDVVPLIGPSSILLAMMASGFNGQSFSFHGYLPKNSDELKSKVANLEQRSKREKQTQIFIETPYRTDGLLSSLIQTCKAETSLCIAVNINCENEKIISKPVKWWKNQKIKFGKAPAVFLIYSR